MIDGGKFPALAPNAFELPYAVRPRGASLYLTAIVSAVILLAGLAFAAFFVLAPGKPDVGRYIALLGPGVIALIFGRQLWLLYRPAVTLYADRIERRGLFGAPRVLQRNEIKGVGPDISTRYGAYFEVLSLLDGGPIRLPSSARKDPVVAAWLRGAPDPDAEQRAADRAAVLNDPRFGVTAAARDANLSRAKAVTIGFTFICLPLGYWVAIFPQPYWAGIAASVLAPLVGLSVIRLFNGLVLWMGTSKVQPQVGVVSMAPLLGLAIGAMTKNRLYDPFTLGFTAGVLGVIVGVVIYTTREQTPLRQSYAVIGGLSAAAAIFGFGSLLDQTLDRAPSKTYVVQVLDKHETHGRSAADYLNLAGWPGRPTGDLAVHEDLYQTPVGSYVCAHDHRGAFALAWFEMSACPAAALPSPAQASTSHDDFTDRLTRYYPERAQRMEVEGSAEVECRVSESLALGQCRPLTETPAGYGFGEAAVRMLQSGHLKLSPKPGEKTFRTRIRFRLKD